MTRMLFRKHEQFMWVKDPKKQKFWKKMAEISETSTLGYPVKLVKVVE